MPGYSEKKEGYSARRIKITATPSYKEPLSLKRFITDRGKIIPSKRTGVSAKMQKEISKQIKRARFMALLPYTDRHAL